ncbi:MAG: HEAT repeat domain-containing protein [Planctomycetota bacterium]
MNDELEVFFCDLCGTSVPATDLDRARAERMHGKIIGHCCLTDLRPNTNAGSTRGALMAGVLVLMVAVASLGIFVDWRLTDDAQVRRGEASRVMDMLRGQDDRLGSVEAQLLEVPASGDLEDLQRGSENLRDGLINLDQSLARSLDASDAKLQVLMESMGELRRAIDLQSARIADMQEQSDQALRDLSGLLAQPGSLSMASGPENSSFPNSAAGRGGALPEELARHLPALRDSDAGTRFEAVDELLQSGDEAVYDHILPLAKDPDPFVRRLVLEGLAGDRDITAVDTLLLALGDEESLVRYTAIASLKKLTGQSFPFDAEASADQRSAMEKRWTQWWSKNKADFF